MLNLFHFLIPALQWVRSSERWVFVLCVLMVSGIIIGFFTGRAWSPDYANPKSSWRIVQVYVSNRSARGFPRRFSKELDSQGRLIKLVLEAQTYRFACDKAVTVVYDATSDSIQQKKTENGSREAYINLHLSGIEFNEAVTLLLNGISSYAANNGLNVLWEYVSETSVRETTTAILNTLIRVTGVGVGFWWGLNPTPGCGSLEAKNLLLDKAFWQGVGEQDRGHVAWEFHWFSRYTLPFAYRQGERILPNTKCTEKQLQRPRKPLKDDFLRLRGNPAEDCAGWPSTQISIYTLSEDMRPCQDEQYDCPKGWTAWPYSYDKSHVLVSDLLSAQEELLATKFNLLLNGCHERRSLSINDLKQCEQGNILEDIHIYYNRVSGKE